MSLVVWLIIASIAASAIVSLGAAFALRLRGSEALIFFSFLYLTYFVGGLAAVFLSSIHGPLGFWELLMGDL